MMRKPQSILTILMLSAALVISGCQVFGVSLDLGCSDSLDDIVASLQPQLPAGATVLEESCTEGFAPGNATVRVTFTMSPDDLETFQQSTLITDWQDTVPGDYTYGGESIDTLSALYGNYGDGATITDVLIDTSDPALYTVYYSNSFID